MHSVYHDLKHGKADVLFYRAVVLVQLELGAAIDRCALLLPLSLLQTNLSKGIWKCSFCGQANMQSDYLAQAQGVRGWGNGDGGRSRPGEWEYSMLLDCLTQAQGE